MPNVLRSRGRRFAEPGSASPASLPAAGAAQVRARDRTLARRARVRSARPPCTSRRRDGRPPTNLTGAASCVRSRRRCGPRAPHAHCSGQNRSIAKSAKWALPISGAYALHVCTGNSDRAAAVGQWGGAGGALCEDHFAFCGELQAFAQADSASQNPILTSSTREQPRRRRGAPMMGGNRHGRPPPYANTN